MRPSRHPALSAFGCSLVMALAALELARADGTRPAGAPVELDCKMRQFSLDFAKRLVRKTISCRQFAFSP